jgi:hypothetical protein
MRKSAIRAFQRNGTASTSMLEKMVLKNRPNHRCLNLRILAKAPEALRTRAHPLKVFLKYPSRMALNLRFPHILPRKRLSPLIILRAVMGRQIWVGCIKPRFLSIIS